MVGSSRLTGVRSTYSVPSSCGRGTGGSLHKQADNARIRFGDCNNKLREAMRASCLCNASSWADFPILPFHRPSLFPFPIPTFLCPAVYLLHPTHPGPWTVRPALEGTYPAASLATTMKLSSAKPATAGPAAALFSLALLASPASSMFWCNHVQVDGQKWNFQELAGPHSVVTWQKQQPFEFVNSTYTLDLCAPLKKDGPADESCPNGARGQYCAHAPPLPLRSVAPEQTLTDHARL